MTLLSKRHLKQSEDDVNINFEEVRPADIGALRTMLNERSRDKDSKISVPEDIEAVIDFIFMLKEEDEWLTKILKATRFPHELSETPLEKTAKRIYAEEKINTIMGRKKEKGTKKLMAYVWNYMKDAPEAALMDARIKAHNVYKRFRNGLNARIGSISKSKKYSELSSKHSDIDINTILALGFAHGKIDPTHDDLAFLDDLITLLKTQITTK